MSGGGSRARSIMAWVLFAVVVVVVVVAAGGSSNERAYDPRSTSPRGAKAAVELLRELDAEVAITKGTDAAALARFDRVAAVALDLSDRQRETLDAWVERGGTLVLADSSTGKAERQAVGFAAGVVAPGQCTLTALGGLASIDVAGSSRLDVEPGDRSCYGTATAALVVSVPAGRGSYVRVASPELFVNETLGSADNAPVVAALLAPRPAMRVAWIERDVTGAGDQSLYDLLPRGVIAMFLELGIAFVVFALARARRHGKVVAEPQPVQIEGSELVVAVGNLLHRANRRTEAVNTIRSDVLRLARERFGVSAASSPEATAEVLAARAGVDRDEVLAALTPGEVADDQRLVTAAQRLQRLREDMS